MHSHCLTLPTFGYSRLQARLPLNQRHNSDGVDSNLHQQNFLSTYGSQRAALRVTVQCSSEDAQSDQNPPAEAQQASTPNSSAALAIGSIALAVVAFVASRTLLGRPALDELRLQSMPLDSALENGKPTLLEFYADWCEVCNELAPVTLQVRYSILACSYVGLRCTHDEFAMQTVLQCDHESDCREAAEAARC